MTLNQISSPPDALSRRQLFSILPLGAAGCLGCVGHTLCSAQTATPAAAEQHTPAEKADMSWEDVFRFTYQRNFIPVMKGLGAQIGSEKLCAMLREGTSDIARKSMANTPDTARTFENWTGGLRKPAPMFQHALVAQVVEDSPKAFEIKVSQCLWAKIFRGEDAAEIGYSAMCHPDFAVASAFNPKMKMLRTKTLMQGHDCCNHRWVMEA